MASGVTDFGAAHWLAAFFGVTGIVTSYYIAVCTDQPGNDADGTILAEIEPQDPAYSRKLYGTGSTYWGINGSYLSNTLDIDFGVGTVDWGRIDHYVLCTDAVGGDIYAFGEFLSPLVVTAQIDFTIPAGGMVISLAARENSIAI